MASERAARAEPAEPAQGREIAAKPVDLTHLARYTLGEHALEREVLELFCTQSVLYLEQLRAAMSDKDWRNAAHSLKGSASAIGAWRAAQAAERAEALKGDGLRQFRSARIAEIESSLREVEAFVTSVLNAR
jgi:HPt (histidine-containing phosphotransfer) domain-containing protein